MRLYSGGNCPKCGGVVKDVYIRIKYEEAIERTCTNCGHNYDERPLDWVDVKEIQIQPIGDINAKGSRD